MNRIKEVLNVNLIADGGKSVKKTVTSMICGVLGYIFASFDIFKGTFPFGVAFVPCGGLGGLVGVLLGTWLNGEDIFRYLTAAAVNYFSFSYLKKSLDLPKGTVAFMTTLWSVLFAGILGLFLVDTSFSENCYFALSGVVSGFFAYVFLIYKDHTSVIDVSRRNGVPVNKRGVYVACLASLSVFIVAFSSMGKVQASAAAVLSFLCVFTVSSSRGFLNTVVFSSVIGFSLLLADGSNITVLASLMFGALLSSIVMPLGKYAVFTSYAVAGLITGVYFRDDGIPVQHLFNITSAGVIFLMLPKTVYRVITEVVIPQVRQPTPKIKRKNKVKKSFSKGIKVNKHMCNTCASCKNKYICWLRDYGYTIGVFEDFKRDARSGDAVLPGHFKAKCPFSQEVYSELSSFAVKTGGYKIEYAKCSEPKAGQTVCGDSCCVFSSSEHRMVVCLADGMGSGPAAAQESVKFSRLMEDLMTKGIAKEDAIRIINETIINSGYETVLALDIAVIDLNTGVCEFVKAGAAPTYVIRHGCLYELGSGSVPIGILDEPELEYERSVLMENDVFIMVSDGLISDGAQWLAVLVKKMSELETLSPLLLSSNIISGAKELKKHILDDISVVAVKIISK